jgi:hypothetical protein
MESQLESTLQKILAVTENTDHIPPIKSNDANPFPYRHSYKFDSGRIGR